MGSYRSYYDIKGRPDKIIDCCMSFKIKDDSDGNILEYHARCNANGRPQEVGAHGDTIASTFKIQLYPINVRHCSNDADLTIAGSLYIYKPEVEFPAQKCRTEKKVPARDHSHAIWLHGCRIATDLADTTCTSQLRATPRCDFSRIAAGETIFFVKLVSARQQSFDCNR